MAPRSGGGRSSALVLVLACAGSARVSAAGNDAAVPAVTAPESRTPPVAAPPAAAPPPAAIEDPTTGYFRFDMDKFGTQLWAGAYRKVGSLTFASDVYILDKLAELDLGLTFGFDKLSLTGFAGVTFDFGNANVYNLVVPQLISAYAEDAFYAESWLQLFLGSPFADAGQNYFYTRDFVVFKVADELKLGGYVELTYQINNLADVLVGPMTMGQEAGVISLPVGAAASIGYGKNNTLLLFLGYETSRKTAPDSSDKIAGRFSYIRSW